MIHEADVLDPIEVELATLIPQWYEDDEYAQALWEYQREVNSCCGGRNRNCIHWRGY